MTDQEYPTTDFNLACTLFTLGHRVLGLDKSNPKKAKFLFADSDTLRSTIDEYWDKKLRIEPNAFMAAWKQLKNRLYSTEI